MNKARGLGADSPPEGDALSIQDSSGKLCKPNDKRCECCDEVVPVVLGIDASLSLSRTRGWEVVGKMLTFAGLLSG